MRKSPVYALAALTTLLVFVSGLEVRAQSGDDPIAEIRDDARRLIDEGRLRQALTLLRAINVSTLPEDRALELKSWIASVESRKAAKLDADLREARRLVREADFDGARAVLDEVKGYGGTADVERAEAERARVDDAERAAADAEAAAEREAEEARVRAREKLLSDAKRDTQLAGKLIQKWLKKRTQLLCSGCRGTKRKRCSSCSGRGKKQVISAYGGGSTWIDCGICKGDGRRACRDCKASGFNHARIDDVLYDPLPPAFRKQLGRKRDYVKGLGQLIDDGEATSLAARHMHGSMGWALQPVRAYSEVEVTLVPGETTASVRYAVQVGDTSREERVSVVKVDGKWYLDPPPLPAPAPPALPPAGDGG